MDRKKIIYKIIEIVCTAIISIAAVLTAQSCTLSLSVSKNNHSSDQYTRQGVTVNNDSVSTSFK
uniref:Small hydrophobic protein n=1 Tax=Dulem virus 263 TaxID=3145740 RepID=A0AAU8ATJ5_9VIRU